MQNHTHHNTKHGFARRGQKTKTYLTWEAMLRRCYMPSQSSYPDYGGRGITVCDEWKDFVKFISDMGEQPHGMSIDRIDPNLGYSKDNCRWATAIEQARNKRSTRWLELNGEKKCLTEWASILRIQPKTLRARIDDHGWSDERALTTPVRKMKNNSVPWSVT